MSFKDGHHHVSFSELTVADKCQFRHNLIYKEGHRDPDTVHTVFGNATHESIDKKLSGESNPWISSAKTLIRFIKENPEDKYGNKLDYKKWCKSLFFIYNEIFEWIERNFENYELIGSEVKLYEDIDETWKFKGFVDLLIKDQDGIYHLIDFKTTNWGWKRDQKSDTTKKYQIRLYKYWVSKKLDIDQKKIKCYFVLLKRNPSKNSPRVEKIDVTSGPKAQKNSVEWMNKNLKKIKKGKKMKNRTACQYCSFKNTDLCP